MNSRVKALSGAKPYVFFSGNVAPEVRRLFPQVRASIWESCRQKSAKDCGESSILHFKTAKKTDSHRALLDDEVGKMCTRL